MGKFIISLRNSAGKMLEAISFPEAKEAADAFEMLGDRLTIDKEQVTATLSYKMLNLPMIHIAHVTLQHSNLEGDQDAAEKGKV